MLYTRPNSDTQESEKINVMLVEDDASLAEWVSDYLISHGYLVTHANRGDMAIELIKADDPDVVLLDVMLPEKDGFDVCREVRAFYRKPILMMTACTEETDEILGLELGADDYLAKPIKPRVLLARIKALLRRKGEEENATSNQRNFGEFSIDAESRTASLCGELVPVSSHEFTVLWFLAERAGQVVSRDDLISAVRGIEYDGLDRSVDICVSRLRKKLNDNPDSPRRIKTVRGKGYLFTTDAW